MFGGRAGERSLFLSFVHSHLLDDTVVCSNVGKTQANRGRIVRWVVQVVSLQSADPLRRALQPDEPYLLAMGPSGENAILYVAVPPALLDEARRIAPLAEVTITARVRNGRSQPTGAPVLDLISLAKR